MKRDYFGRLGMLVLTILLLLNLAVNSRFRAAAQESEAPAAIHYQLVRVDSSTNQEVLFKDAARRGMNWWAQYKYPVVPHG